MVASIDGTSTFDEKLFLRSLDLKSEFRQGDHYATDEAGGLKAFTNPWATPETPAGTVGLMNPVSCLFGLLFGVVLLDIFQINGQLQDQLIEVRGVLNPDRHSVEGVNGGAVRILNSECDLHPIHLFKEV